MTVFRDLTSPSTTWTCAWARSSDSSPSATRQSPGRVFVDGHGHSLLVQCDVPSSDAAALSVGADGRLESRVTLTATRSSGSTGQSTTLFGVRNVPVCALPITSAPPAPRMLELAACTQVTEISPMFDTAALTRQWVDCKPFNVALSDVLLLSCERHHCCHEMRTCIFLHIQQTLFILIQCMLCSVLSETNTLYELR